MHKIYISPANHYKKYEIQGYTEKEQMDKLAPLLIKVLERYEDVEVILTSVYDPDRSYTGRPEEAANLGCDIYVALHTNAGGGKGACVFYHPSFEKSEKLAVAVVNSLNAICPIKSNRAVQPAVYPWSKVLWNFGELREPASLGICPILIEHEFHDTTAGAHWIINNLGAIAKADAEGIADALGLKRKLGDGDVNGDGFTDSLDAAKILKYDAGIDVLTEEQKNAADANGDGEVDGLDAAFILKADTQQNNR